MSRVRSPDPGAPQEQALAWGHPKLRLHPLTVAYEVERFDLRPLTVDASPEALACRWR